MNKAVITIAAPGQHTLPLQRTVDRSGQERFVMELILDEVAAAGIEETCLVIHPGDAVAYQDALERYPGRITFVEQPQPLGYADAIFRTREFVGDQPFLHLVGDHLYLSHTDRHCARQLIDLARSESCSVSAVHPTRESKLPYFGAVAAERVAGREGVYEISDVVEKPSPTEAEQRLIVAGLRAGYYLCLFGMHVLSAEVMNILDELFAESSSPKNVQFADALARLAQRERYLALEISGTRFNIGVKYGLLFAQLALALSGKDRDQIMQELLELVAK